MADTGRLLTAVSATLVAAVGHATASALEARGVRVDLVPAEQTAEHLVTALRERGLAGQRFWLPQGNLARTTLADGLRVAGAQVETTVVYRTVPNDRLDPDVRQQIVGGAVDVLTFASPSAVRSFLDALGSDRDKVTKIAAVAIGPTTADSIRDQALNLAAVADDASASGIIRALGALVANKQT
jgi:uroporphyrinogen-III synthase